MADTKASGSGISMYRCEVCGNYIDIVPAQHPDESHIVPFCIPCNTHYAPVCSEV